MPSSESGAPEVERPDEGAKGFAGAADHVTVGAAVTELTRRMAQPAVEFTASGTAALEAALEVLGIGRGDEVVVPDVGCHSVAAAVVRRGAIPVFTGVGEALTLDPRGVALACGPRTRAVVAVHQYGLPCDVPGIMKTVGPDIPVIEDVAQTWGSAVGGAPAGSLGTIAVISFGSTKPVALGAGGALFGPASLIGGAVSRGDGADRQLLRPPSAARFPAPLLARLPKALARADRLLASRRAAVEAFLRGPLAQELRLPPTPPGSSSGWTRTPLYPIAPATSVTAEQVERLEACHGPVQRMHATPPSALPMFRGSTTRVTGGGRRLTEPLLVKMGSPR
ncbi:DegT/DnrJ/EryC1/StrS family aminotransferase [Streptomyces californicus]|uniref:DegT/DnrJ/EryC1/StrS family aminotransferase n=1 Tax=Streptomyces californicus TaxID=67351 RepID=UPI0036FFD161